MRRTLLLMIVLLSADRAVAQLVASTPGGVVVAHDGRIALGGRWSAEGVRTATAIVTSPDRVAVLDALHNQAVVVELATGLSRRSNTSETPIAAAFLGDELWVLARDARLVENGERRIAVGADPAFLAAAAGKLYVYSRAAGVLEEIDGGRVSRRLSVAPFASDLEIAGTTAYLVYPRNARIRTVDLASMKESGEIAVGAVPVDVAIAGGGSAITAPVLAVADPSAKRVWMTESTQSTAKAVARGFLRGFLGLGLFGSRSSAFPTGIDRVLTRGNRWIAWDASSGTLYRFTGRTSSVIATGVPRGAFALTPDGVAWWNGTSVAQSDFR